LAIRSEALHGESEALVLEFPVRRARARAARARRAVLLRRRVAVAGAVVAVVAGLVALAGPPGPAVASRPGAPAQVVVGPGDTLWELAGRYAPRGIDPRAYVDALARLNHLPAGVQAGQRLRLPR